MKYSGWELKINSKKKIVYEWKEKLKNENDYYLRRWWLLFYRTTRRKISISI